MKRSFGNSAILAGVVVFSVALLRCAGGDSAGLVRKRVIYLLPHSHVDIGYTHIQNEVERAQWKYIEQGIEAARRTADYPPGARFKWNVEVLWAVDGYLQQANPARQQEFVDAVRKGWIGLDALYCNELTGLCRPEELMRLTDYAQCLSQRCGVRIDSAMISDVPGCTWGLTSVFAANGVKYLSSGPNLESRIGYTLAAWADRPFYWTTPDGKHRVLCWIPGTGYWQWFKPADAEQRLVELLRYLEGRAYPYDMTYIRYCLGDNSGPANELCDFVKTWNSTHESLQLVIATTSEMMHEFERRYADKIPEFRGDFTPYWEDGAGSSARETAINRGSAERLIQAESLFAMLNPTKYPKEQFDDAWRNVILYDEHTWGANTSVRDPDLPFTHQVWQIKQGFALDGDRQSRQLLVEALSQRGEPVASAIDVFNTSSWPRTDLAVLSKEMSSAGDLVTDAQGQIVPSQRLSTGELAFLAKDVPPLAGCRYTVSTGKGLGAGSARGEGATLTAGTLIVKIDPQNGEIFSLKAGREEFVDAAAGVGLNRYIYLPGQDVKEAQSNGPVKIRMIETGPLVAAIEIASDAPGCHRLIRQVRLVDGLDYVELVNVVDKKAIRDKEGVHFGFGFHVPKGVVRLDIPWAVVRPEVDQLPGSCMNWFTVQRFVDISNEQSGVTWATLDAPLVEVGGLTANLASYSNESLPNASYLARIQPSQTIYSWVMNNHWFTNYRAEQSGSTTFRYAIRPHDAYDAGAAQRFGIERSHPLVVYQAQGLPPTGRPLLRIEPSDVIVTSLQPMEGENQIAVRLFNSGAVSVKTTIHGGDTDDSSGAWTIEMAPWEIVTIRVPAAR